MKTHLIALSLGVAALGAGPVSFAPAVAYAQDEVSFEFFQEALSPYGDWIQVGDYGLCWQPSGVGADWSPYTDGYWSYTDAGWTWVSYEDFGGITYHYGRWVSVEDAGWCWVPDYDWGPAWVSWRNNDDYVGWAPLPPEARWDSSVGIGITVDSSYDIGPEYYNFCGVADFGAPVIREVLIPRPRNSVIIVNTVNITNITINTGFRDGYWGGGVPFCGGPRYDFISRRVSRPIPALKLVRETNITNIYNNTVVNKNVTIINKNGGGRGRAIQAVQRGNELIVPAPRIRRMENPMAQLKIKPQRVIAKNQVRLDRGWKLEEKAGNREEIRERMNRGTANLPRGERAKARPIQASDLAVVPTKGDPNASVPGGNGRNRRDRAQQDRNGGNQPGEATAQTPGTTEPGRPGQGPRRNPGEGAVAERPGRGQTPDSVEPGRPGQGPKRNPGEGAVAERPGRGRGEGRGQQPQAGGTAEAQPTPVAPGEPTPGVPPEEGRGGKRGKNGNVTEATPANDMEGRREKARGAAEAARAEAMQRKEAEASAETRRALKEQQQAEQSRKQERQAAEAAEQRTKRMERLQNQKQGGGAEEARPQRQKDRSDDADDRGAAIRERAAAQAEARQKAQAQGGEQRRQMQQQAERNQAARQQQQAERNQAARQQQQAERSQMQRQQMQQERQPQQQMERNQAARQQQVERNQAARQQQQQQMQQRAMQAQRQQQAERSQQMQRQQMQMQQQRQQQQQGQGGGGGGGGRGKKNLTPEEIAARQGR